MTGARCSVLFAIPMLDKGGPDRVFYELLRREGVTVLNQTPSSFRQLAKVEDGAGVARDLALRYVSKAWSATRCSS